MEDWQSFTLRCENTAKHIIVIHNEYNAMDVGLGGLVLAGSVAGSIISAALAVQAWRERSAPGAVPFGWLMVTVSGWCLLNIAWLTITNISLATILFSVTRLFEGVILGLWFVFTLVYTGRDSLVTPGRIAVILLVPSLYGIVAITNPIHGLARINVIELTENSLTLFAGQTGPLYTVQLAIGLAVVLIGYALFSDFLLRSRNLYRQQTFLILSASLLTAGTHGLFVVGATPHPGLDVTPLSFALNGVLVGVALFRYDFLSITPLAGDLLVDELPDPILALDSANRVIDHNAAASDLIDAEQVSGQQLTDIAPGLFDDIERDEVFAMGDPLSYYDPKTRPVRDQHGAVRGRLVVLREVTDQQQQKDRLEALQAATRQFIEVNQPERVANLAVNFATRVLDQPAAAVLLRNEEGHLEPTAVSDILESVVESGDLYINPDDTPDHDIWEAYQSRQRRVETFEHGSMESAIMIPLGEHGIIIIASRTGEYETEDEQYAGILAQTTQVALEQHIRQRELKQSQSSLERRNEQIEFFNGVLRHSLRNAMLVVRGRADHLHEAVDEEHVQHIESITTWCEKLSDMSSTIRDINETVTASEGERLEPVSLTDTFDNVVETAMVGDHNAEIEMDIDDEWVLANDLAEEVLTTIVENAIEHNDSDTPEIEISYRDAGDWIQVRIADNGPGISDELKETMFERSISSDQTAGGFGLNFVSVMMDLYGGKVWYEDNHPTGAIAVLEFQRADNPSDDSADTVSVGTEAQTKSPND
jgi:signal transduction histidine kinase/PAS domain-containing protein